MDADDFGRECQPDEDEETEIKLANECGYRRRQGDRRRSNFYCSSPSSSNTFTHTQNVPETTHDEAISVILDTYDTLISSQLTEHTNSNASLIDISHKI